MSMLEKIGHTEISNAFRRMKSKLVNDSYRSFEIDEMLIKELGIENTEDFSSLTQNSNEFCYLAEVYELINNTMRRYGFNFDEEKMTYFKSAAQKKREADMKLEELAIKLF